MFIPVSCCRVGTVSLQILSRTRMHRQEMKLILRRIFRTKSPESVTSDTNLHRCLGIVDLVVIGIGGMIGSGIYVMTGITAKEQAGNKCKLMLVFPILLNLLRPTYGIGQAIIFLPCGFFFYLLSFFPRLSQLSQI